MITNEQISTVISIAVLLFAIIALWWNTRRSRRELAVKLINEWSNEIKAFRKGCLDLLVLDQVEGPPVLDDQDLREIVELKAHEQGPPLKSDGKLRAVLILAGRSSPGKSLSRPPKRRLDHLR